MPKSKEELEKLIRPTSYHHPFEIRAGVPGEGEPKDQMIIEGKAITFNERTLLFTYAGTKVYESIDSRAMEGCDMSDCFLKYNHSEDIMVMARTKNHTLEITNKPDGVYIRALLANTTAGRDLYELAKRGDLDKMSFAFTIASEERDDSVEGETTFTVRKIGKLYDVAAVPLPAYEDTDLYARRRGDVETRLEQLESEKREKENRRLRVIGLAYLGEEYDPNKK